MLDFDKDGNQWPVASSCGSLPEEIAELVVFMCSNMVGCIVTCDGGENLR